MGPEVLRKKLAASQSTPSAKPGSLQSLLRVTMPRDADDVLAVDVNVLSVEEQRLEKDALLGVLEDTHLIYLFENEENARGIIRLSPGLLAALVEIQMAGRVLAAEPSKRVPTRTDGAVAGEIVDRWLNTAEVALAEAGMSGAFPVAGFRRLADVVRRREVDLLLEPISFRVFTISLSVDGGTKTGDLQVSLPIERAARFAVETHKDVVRARMPNLPVSLKAVLARKPVEVSLLRRLSEGDVLNVSPEDLRNVRLETSLGKQVGVARLGQLNGLRAVRLPGKSAQTSVQGGMLVQPTVAQGGQISDLPQMGTPEPVLADDPVVRPTLPDLPAIGDNSEPAKLPDLPELPELPDLPDLPDLPELPDLP